MSLNLEIMILTGQVADLLPLDVLRIVDSVWKETCIIYLDLEKLLVREADHTRYLLSVYLGTHLYTIGYLPTYILQGTSLV